MEKERECGCRMFFLLHVKSCCRNGWVVGLRKNSAFCLANAPSHSTPTRFYYLHSHSISRFNIVGDPQSRRRHIDAYDHLFGARTTSLGLLYSALRAATFPPATSPRTTLFSNIDTAVRRFSSIDAAVPPMTDPRRQERRRRNYLSDEGGFLPKRTAAYRCVNSGLPTRH